MPEMELKEAIEVLIQFKKQLQEIYQRAKEKTQVNFFYYLWLTLLGFHTFKERIIK